MDRSFYDHPVHHKHVISDFSLIEPRGIGRQQIGSNDYEVWVAQWMEKCVLKDEYGQVFVSTLSIAPRSNFLVCCNINFENESKLSNFVNKSITRSIF